VDNAIFFLELLPRIGGGSGKKKHTIFPISADRWNGCVSLIYAQHKGWLEPCGITVSQGVSWHKSMRLFEDGYADAVAVAQVEWLDSGAVSSYASQLPNTYRIRYWVRP